MSAVQGETPYQSLQLLLVSDNPADLAEVTCLLRPEYPHLRVEQVADAAQLTAALAARQFDLALVESWLPWADSLVVSRTIQDAFPERPIVLIVDAAGRDRAEGVALRGLAGYVVRDSQQMMCLAMVVRLALEHAQERQARKEAEARYRNLFDAVPVGLYRATPKGRILDANLALVQMLGYPGREALLAVNVHDLYTDAGVFRGLCVLLEQREDVRPVETQLNRLDGTATWVEHTLRARRDAQQALYYEGMLWDVSGRKQVEIALRESEERFRTIVEQSPISIQVMTPDGWTVQVNRAWEKLWGVTAADVRSYNMLHDEQAISLGMMPYVQRGFAGETVSMPPVAYHTPETIKLGRKRWFQTRIYPVKGERGEIRNVIMTYEDISERQWATEDLQRLSAQLMNAQEVERKRISRELHDELGQTLTAMRINLASLENDLLPTLSAAHGDKLVETGRLADEMLEHEHELSLAFRPTMLDELGLVPTLRWYIDRYARRLGIEVEFEARGLEDRLPVEIETALYRVVQEALTNIARHAQARRVRLHLAHRGSKVTASIQDDGAGFDLEQRTAVGLPDSGAGLIGMRERVALLGGAFSIRAAPGQGTRLSVTIPVSAQPSPGGP